MRMAKWLLTTSLGLVLLIFPGLRETAIAAKVTGKYAVLVLDANTGKVLHARNARKLRYPASLTKMMTLYIMFEHIEDGKLSYSTEIVASKEAALRPPSKIGLKPGDKITVSQAVKALVTKSANDVAAAVGGHIAGSERAFARLMTQKARELGLRQTVFRNASGLPDRNQVTTARDMAILALRLRDHFPNHYHHFKTRRFTYNGKTFKNHNVLIGRYSGVDGVKTGYIRASGFNLVTSLRHGGRDIVAVVMGGKTSRSRNAEMRRLLSKYVKSGAAVATRKRDVRFSLRQNSKPIPLPARRFAALAETSKSSVASAQRPAAAPRRSYPNQNQAARVGIQVGAYLTLDGANRQLDNVSAKAGDLLNGFRPITSRRRSGKREIYRARFAGNNSEKAALTCSKLKELGVECFVVRTAIK